MPATPRRVPCNINICIMPLECIPKVFKIAISDFFSDTTINNEDIILKVATKTISLWPDAGTLHTGSTGVSDFWLDVVSCTVADLLTSSC